MSSRRAYATLLTQPTYLPGLLVLDYGLRAVKSKYPLVAMVTPNLPRECRDVLHKRGIRTREVQPLHPEASRYTLNPQDARFADIWAKLRCFELVEFDVVVLLDSDMVIKKNMDDLFEIDLPAGQIAAAHVCACNPRKLKHYPADWVPENCAHTFVSHPRAPPPQVTSQSPRPYNQFNSGTVVLRPSRRLSEEILHYFYTTDKLAEFTFCDQDLLNAFFFGRWKPLPWYYNALKTLRNVHRQLWDDNEVRCLHYILADKPWKARVSSPETAQQYGVVNSWWWAHFDKLGEELQRDDPQGWRLVLRHVQT